MSRTLRMFTIGVAAFAVLGIAACSGGDEEDDGGDATEAATSEGDGGGEGAVAVALSEFAIEADPGEIAAGEVTFDVSNAGALPHEFLVVKTDTAAADLPTTATGADLTGLEEVGRIDQFNPASEESTSVELEAGHYVLICNIAGHYAGGMHADFTVQ